LEIDLTQTEQSGGLGVLAGILGADLGGELLTDSFKDGARLLSLACARRALAKRWRSLQSSETLVARDCL